MLFGIKQTGLVGVTRNLTIYVMVEKVKQDAGRADFGSHFQWRVRVGVVQQASLPTKRFLGQSSKHR